MNVYENKSIGLGNVVDISITSFSTTGIGTALGVGYIATDYLLYRYTGIDIRHKLNNIYSISW